MKRFRWFTAFLLIVLAPPIASAAPIFVDNPSFESPSTNDIGVLPSPWVPIANPDPNVYNPFQYLDNNAWYQGANSSTDPGNGGVGYPGMDGRNLSYVFQRAAGTGIEQALSAVLAPDTAYTLTVAFGRRNGSDFAAPTLGSLIELLAGNVVIASSQNDTGPLPGQFVEQVALLPNSNAFAALYGESLTIRLTTTQAFTTQYQATDWDNVRLDATAVGVPEPSSILVFGLSLMSVAAIRSRRSRL
jgi:hypothetical protein